MAEKRSILFQLLGDSRSLERATKAGKGSLDTLGGAFKRVAGFAAGAFAADRVLDFVGDAVQLAAAAEEVDSKFEAVFGTADELEAKLSELGDTAGITDADIKGLSATFGNLAQAQGITGEATQELTLDVAELAGDLASFNDADPAQVFGNLTKAILTTEREGLKPLGIAVSEAEVKTRALAIATADNRTEVTKADRALASYRIVVEQSGKAIGDLDRTSDSAANQQRQLRASIEELQTEIGRELLPVFRDFLQLANDAIPVVRTLAGALTSLAGPQGVGGVSGHLKDATDSGDSWLDNLVDLDNAARGLLSTIGGSTVDINSWAKDVEAAKVATKGAAEATQEWGDLFSGAMRSAYIEREELRRSLGEPLPDPDAQAAIDEMHRLSRAIIAAKLEHIRLRDQLGRGLPTGGQRPGDADSFDYGDARDDFERTNGP